MGGAAAHVADDEDRRRRRPGAVQRERRPRALGEREGQPSDAARQRDTEPQRARGRRQAVLRDEPQERREVGAAQGMEHAMPAGSRHVASPRSLSSSRRGRAIRRGGRATPRPTRSIAGPAGARCRAGEAGRPASFAGTGARERCACRRRTAPANADAATAGPEPAAKRRKEHKERQDVTAAEQHGPDRERQRLRHAFGRILRKALPYLPSAPIHPAAGQIGRVEQIGRAARPPEGAWQHEPVVPRAPDRGVTAGPLIGVTSHRHELAAARGERRVAAAPGQPDRQVAEQEHVDQRHDQRLGERTGLLLAESRSPDRAPAARAGRRCASAHRARGARRRRRTPAADGARDRRGRGRRAACRTSPEAAAARRRAAGARRPACAPRRWLPVRSVEPSSRTTTSSSTPSLARAARSASPMLASSLRAGISREIFGGASRLEGGGARNAAKLTAVTTAGSRASAEGGIREDLQHHASRPPCSGSKRSPRSSGARPPQQIVDATDAASPAQHQLEPTRIARDGIGRKRVHGVGQAPPPAWRASWRPSSCRRSAGARRSDTAPRAGVRSRTGIPAPAGSRRPPRHEPSDGRCRGAAAPAEDADQRTRPPQ